MAAAAASAAAAGDETKAIEIFKIKKLIGSLDRARGNGTSMISLILPPKSQISQANKMLADEYGTASNIKSRVNRQSVLSAITSTQQRLKNWTKCPPNGLVVFVGDVLTDDGKEKKLAIDFEPFRPINTSLYLCDNRFHTEALAELLSDDESFGFIVMDGNRTLYGRVCGSTREVLHQFTVDLPKKHGRGGQSALRFARLRLEKRHNYIRKVAENAVTQFITDDMPNVKGLVLAGSAEFKNDLQKSDLLDPRLKAVVIKVVDVSYGGENGFNQAIELSSEALSNVKLVEEKKLIGGFFDEIAKDTGLFCFGIKDTMTALEMSACEKLILWEDLPLERFELRNPSTGEASVMYLTPEEAEDRTRFRDAATGVDLDISDHMPFVEWMAEHFSDYGAKLEFVTDRSSEGAQFVRGFGGVGGILRWKVDFVEMDEYLEDDDDFI